MQNFFTKNYIIFLILKTITLIITLIYVYYYYFKKVQLFNENIADYSTRFLIGKFLILLMAIFCILEIFAFSNLFSFYKKKYLALNYILGVVSIIIALPLLYNFVDDYHYFSGKVSPFSFLIPCLYIVSAVFDFSIAGKNLKN